jgi:hypothetical protein
MEVGMSDKVNFDFLVKALQQRVHSVFITSDFITIDDQGPFGITPSMFRAMEEAGFEIPVGYYNTTHYEELMKRARRLHLGDENG